MFLFIVIIIVIGALTGTLGTILQVAAGVVVGLVLFAVGLGLAVYYYARHRVREAAREWERRRTAYPVEGRRDDRADPPSGKLPG